MNSPLLAPVRLDGNRIFVLDETALPFREDYLEVKKLDDALWILGEMKTRSLGQVLLFFYCCALFKGSHSIDDVSAKFKQRRPTFDFLALGDILKGQIKKGMETKEAADSFISGFDALRRKRAKRLASVLSSPANILTICNINGELLYLYKELQAQGKDALFYVSETRPYLQGTRLTFWELNKNNVPSKVICDNQAARIMSEGKITCVVTGADRATVNGDVINKVGTYSLARIAKYFNIPFYPLTQYPGDIDVDNIEIEERPRKESFMYLEEDCLIDAFYPCFDITKSDFITQCIELKP